MHHYNATPYKTILFLHQHSYFPSKLAQIYNIQTRLATKVVCLLNPTSNHNEVKVYAKILLGMIPGSSSGNANTNNKNFVTYSPQNY